MILTYLAVYSVHFYVQFHTCSSDCAPLLISVCKHQPIFDPILKLFSVSVQIGSLQHKEHKIHVHKIHIRLIPVTRAL